MKREIPELHSLMRGVTFKVYQAASRPDEPGPWHAHVSGLRYGDLDDCSLRSASISAESIARRIEEKIASLRVNGSDERLAREEVLASYANRYSVRFQGEPGERGYWTDIGFCSTADEARERSCSVVGHVLGRRLAAATAGFVPEPEPVPAIRQGAF